MDNLHDSNKSMTQTKALKLALEALELAQDNLRDHGENCFLHDEGEYNRCFCGKDSLSDHLQSVVEKLDEALAQPEQEPFGYLLDGVFYEVMQFHFRGGAWEGQIPVYTTAPQRTWVGLTDDEIERIKLLTFEKEINTNGEEQEAVNLDQLIRAAEQLCKEKNYE